jgi:hypothetical protein
MTQQSPPKDPYSLYQSGVKVAEVDGVRVDTRNLYIDHLVAQKPFRLDKPFEFRGKIFQFNAGSPPRTCGSTTLYSRLSAIDLCQV